MRVFADRFEKPKNKTGLKRPERYGIVTGLVLYVMLALSLGLSLVIVFMALLPSENAVIGIYLLRVIAAAVPFVGIALMTLRDQKPVQGRFARFVVTLIYLIAFGVFVITPWALVDALSWISSLPVELRHTQSEYDRYSSKMMQLCFFSLVEGFFFGLGLWGEKSLSRKEPEKAKNADL